MLVSGYESTVLLAVDPFQRRSLVLNCYRNHFLFVGLQIKCPPSVWALKPLRCQVLFLLFLLSPPPNFAADLLLPGLNVCMSGSATSCEECLLINPSCAWCAQEVNDRHPADTCRAEICLGSFNKQANHFKCSFSGWRSLFIFFILFFLSRELFHLQMWFWCF